MKKVVFYTIMVCTNINPSNLLSQIGNDKKERENEKMSDDPKRFHLKYGVYIVEGALCDGRVRSAAGSFYFKFTVTRCGTPINLKSFDIPTTFSDAIKEAAIEAVKGLVQKPESRWSAGICQEGEIIVSPVTMRN